MTTETEGISTWAAITFRLTTIAKEHTASSAFLYECLRLLKETTGCLQATYLRCVADGASPPQVVEEKHFPAKIDFEAVDFTNLTIFSIALLLPEGLTERVLQLGMDDESGYTGLIVQIRLPETGDQHALCLVYDDQPSPPAEAEKENALRFIRFLAHVFNSKRLAEAEKLREFRLEAVTRILAQTGSVQEVAQSLCQIWREWLQVPAMRLWIFNSEFQQLDLLYVCCEPSYTSCFEESGNRLSSNSVGALAINRKTVIRVQEPTSMQEWSRDSGLTELLRKLPQLICVPIISADHLPDDPAKPRFIGLIDLHVGNVDNVQQPDDRLLFVGSMTAAAFLRARSYERYKIIQELNKIAIDLVNPTDRSRLEERKDAYLEKVKQVILNAVQANCLSIFEADESRDLIRCVATTGIEGHDEFKKTVYYREVDGLTWNVFATGKHKLVANIHECPEYKGRFKEKRSLPVPPDHDPLLVFPLPGQTPVGATGAIRVVERTCSVNKNRLQNFSDHDVDLIKLITHQVSPNLQMIRMQAHRDLFVERTAHQVTQPLQGVIAYASNILDGLYKNDPDKLRQKFLYVRQMARAAAGMMRSAAWASGITDFSFLEQIERHPEKLTRYFIDRIIDLQPLREHDEIQVRLSNTEEADQWGNFLVDEQFLDQAVQNLLHNAVKYSYPNTIVWLKVFRTGKELKVWITSTGVPIDLSEPDRIFWDRERGRLASRYDQQGTGQGLYLARQILRGFGGDVELLPPKEDRRATPPIGFPTAQRCTFQIRYPEAFPDEQDENIIRR